MPDSTITRSELGKKSDYDQSYNPKRLFPIPRKAKRLEIGIDPDRLPFHGFDCWNHYEVSWLNAKGKPMVATAEIYYDCTSPCIIESKSLKLYFNSLNNTPFASPEILQKIIKKDLEEAIQAPVTLNLYPLRQVSQPMPIQYFEGHCLDDLDIECHQYQVSPQLLDTENQEVEETVYSDLLKSNCLVTGQPDWGSVQIAYYGKKINHEGLLRYIISFRNHNEFHEQCIERIFNDIIKSCQPKKLTVYGRYTRRGGLDINPYRSTHAVDMNKMNARLLRQ